MARRISLTYRVRLVHLEDDGSFIRHDSGEPISEDLNVTLSCAPAMLRKESPRSKALARAAGQKATKVANAGMATQRKFLVAGVAFVGHRSYPVR